MFNMDRQERTYCMFTGAYVPYFISLLTHIHPLIAFETNVTYFKIKYFLNIILFILLEQGFKSF